MKDTDTTNPTRGADSEGFIDISSKSQEKTLTGKDDLPKDQWGLSYLPGVIKSLEENLPFTGVLIGIIGYIVISSFGHMDTILKYVGYVLFLFLCFLMYRLLSQDRVVIKYDFKNLNIFLVLVLLLIVVLIVEHSNTTYGYLVSLFSRK